VHTDGSLLLKSQVFCWVSRRLMQWCLADLVVGVSRLHWQMQEDENGDHVRNPECPLTGHSIDVTLVEFKKRSERLVRQVFTLAGHAAPVYSVDFSSNGKHFVSGSDGKLLKIWDTETGAQVSSLVGVN